MITCPQALSAQPVKAPTANPARPTSGEKRVPGPPPGDPWRSDNASPRQENLLVRDVVEEGGGFPHEPFAESPSVGGASGGGLSHGRAVADKLAAVGDRGGDRPREGPSAATHEPAGATITERVPNHLQTPRYLHFAFRNRPAALPLSQSFGGEPGFRSSGVPWREGPRWRPLGDRCAARAVGARGDAG